MHWDTFKQGNHSTVGGIGGCRIGEVQAGTTSLIPDHKGFKLQQLSEIHPLQQPGLTVQVLTPLGDTLWGNIKVSLSMHTYPPNLLRKIKVANCHHQVDSPFYLWLGVYFSDLQTKKRVWLYMTLNVLTEMRWHWTTCNTHMKQLCRD